jgi:hypothetical protein
MEVVQAKQFGAKCTSPYCMISIDGFGHVALFYMNPLCHFDFCLIPSCFELSFYFICRLESKLLAHLLGQPKIKMCFGAKNLLSSLFGSNFCDLLRSFSVNDYSRYTRLGIRSRKFYSWRIRLTSNWNGCYSRNLPADTEVVQVELFNHGTTWYHCPFFLSLFFAFSEEIIVEFVCSHVALLALSRWRFDDKYIASFTGKKTDQKFGQVTFTLSSLPANKEADAWQNLEGSGSTGN